MTQHSPSDDQATDSQPASVDHNAAASAQSPTLRSRQRAGLFRVLASMLYDFLPVAGFWLLTSLILVFASGSAVTGALYQTLLFLELFGYFAFSWVHRGQTLGMVAWKLRLEPVPFTFYQAALRLLGAIVGLAAFGLGYFWILIDRDQRSWADILSGSRIDYDPQLGGSWWSGS